MQFKLSLLASVIAATQVIAAPATHFRRFTVSTGNAELDHWFATTDANITFIGKPPVPRTLLQRQATQTTVVTCDTRSSTVCSGTCQTLTTSDTCLSVPGTECMMASEDVAFCDKSGCGSSCNSFADCGTKLDGGFCATPGTNSILVQ
ncbi:hypothetical protein GYMLUDRAFT_50858 [Collybiopsis luxurians FD-317 M1]|uniref:Unplaced genomic scaffold GYMLUscaffold_128, whole genome shotgun sequence n=1 Tax=Collybiopsis luxurians FD-317 M1 TaxID=944289 RepID=A0A0D0C0E2_9AGAR|nr:hypothetical protein GYMLUDRAFT_50858 [Collybiopsis luxurians FD-317 M1]